MFLYELFQNNFEILTTEFFLTTIILILLLFGTFMVNTINHSKVITIQILNNLIIYFLLWVFLLLFYKIPSTITLLNGILLFDELIQFTHGCLILITIVFFIIQQTYILRNKLIQFEISLLILISLFGLLLLSSAYNFITLYLAIEVQSLCFYILAATKKKSTLSLEAALKYFILGSIASGFLLYGISIIYLVTGTLNFSHLLLLLTNLDITSQQNYFFVIIYGLIFLVSGLLFKLGAVPFHTWLPDVYEGTPHNITTFFAITPKFALIALMFRLFFDIFYAIMPVFETIFFIVAILSIFIGSMTALHQTKLKRLFAYSTISHTGFLLIGFSSNMYNNVKYILFYLLIYTIMNINLWTFYLTLTTKHKPLKYITDLTNFLKINPIGSFLISITLLSMAGFPPLLGFFSKMFIFFIAIQNMTYSLTILGILISCIGSFYYLRIIKIMYFDIKKDFLLFDKIPKENAYILTISSISLLGFPLFINLILSYFDTLILTALI